MGLHELFDEGLPMNRKERFFTGTVLPMLVCGDGFVHVGRFLEMLGVRDVEVDATPDSATIQFFTEYSFWESRFSKPDRDRFDEAADMAKDTPDVLIFISAPRRMLVGIEAKMYHRPTKQGLEHQLGRQWQLLAGYLADALDVDPADVHLSALLPQSLVDKVGPLAVAVGDADPHELPTITWEDVLHEYQGADSYWVAVLREALQRYPNLKSRDAEECGRVEYGQNADAKLSGLEIVTLEKAGGLVHRWVGRQGGDSGDLLQADRSSGKWRGHMYECRIEAPPPGNPNWFPVEAFVSMMDPD